MPFIKEDLDDVHEGEAVPEGPYLLRILKVEERTSQKGNAGLAVMLKVVDSEYPNAKPVNLWISDPSQLSDPEKAHYWKLQFKRFCFAFGLPLDCELEDMIGAEAEVQLTQDPIEGTDDDTSNSVNLPKLPRGA